MSQIQSFIVGLLTMGLLVTVVWYARADQSAPGGQKWPTQFPRAGATKVFENGRFVVWDTTYTPGAFMHKHIRDTISITLDRADIIVTPGPGYESKSVDSNAKAGKLPLVSYTKAGHGPHSEHLKDGDTRGGRKLYIEFKGTEPKDCREWSIGC
jgi:hypothetical protein